MKLIIQIPCYNEEKTIPAVLHDLPRSIEGISVIETQIIDDGSTDNTARIAEELGVTHIIRFSHNKGLAAAFRAGVENALLHNADILVNTDGDNQYYGQDIALLVQTMLARHADLVIGCRPIVEHPEFSTFKKLLQRFGSQVVRWASRTDVPDAASGFRAYSRNAMLYLNIFSSFSYCMETLIQIGLANMKVTHVPVRINPKTRESRLFRTNVQYVCKQLHTIVTMCILYRTRLFFNTLAGVLLCASVLLATRFAYFVWIKNAPATLWPTILLSGIFLVIACLVHLVGILAALLNAQRKLSEESLYHLRRLNLVDRGIDRSTDEDAGQA
jgi:glycosyltransferase involved in cell wall biosynthesis